ncbi:hypothetical protein R6Q57_002269 [Mikania cordata]
MFLLTPISLRINLDWINVFERRTTTIEVNYTLYSLIFTTSCQQAFKLLSPSSLISFRLIPTLYIFMISLKKKNQISNFYVCQRSPYQGCTYSYNTKIELLFLTACCSCDAAVLEEIINK